MAERRPRPDHVQQALRRSENPYAVLSTEFADDDYDTELSKTRRQRDFLANFQNPYVFVTDVDPSTTVQSGIEINQSIAAQRHERKLQLSKKDFRAQCHRILGQYLPPAEGTTLRKHHRDFVLRNESKPADIRHLLVAKLKKYDLSTLGNYRPYFNREEDWLTKEKLKDIEKEVEKK